MLGWARSARAPLNSSMPVRMTESLAADSLAGSLTGEKALTVAIASVMSFSQCAPTRCAGFENQVFLEKPEHRTHALKNQVLLQFPCRTFLENPARRPGSSIRQIA